MMPVFLEDSLRGRGHEKFNNLHSDIGPFLKQTSNSRLLTACSSPEKEQVSLHLHMQQEVHKDDYQAHHQQQPQQSLTSTDEQKQQQLPTALSLQQPQQQQPQHQRQSARTTSTQQVLSLLSDQDQQQFQLPSIVSRRQQAQNQPAKLKLSLQHQEQPDFSLQEQLIPSQKQQLLTEQPRQSCSQQQEQQPESQKKGQQTLLKRQNSDSNELRQLTLPQLQQRQPSTTQQRNQLLQHKPHPLVLPGVKPKTAVQSLQNQQQQEPQGWQQGRQHGLGEELPSLKQLSEQAQAMAWSGGSAIAGAFWTAQEKMLQQIKQLQMLENPFAVPKNGTAASSSSPSSGSTSSSSSSDGSASSSSSSNGSSASSSSSSTGTAADDKNITCTKSGTSTPDSALQSPRTAAAAVAAEATPAAVSYTAPALAQGTSPTSAEEMTGQSAAASDFFATGCLGPRPLLPQQRVYKLVTFSNGVPAHVPHYGHEPSSFTPTQNSSSQLSFAHESRAQKNYLQQGVCPSAANLLHKSTDAGLGFAETDLNSPNRKQVLPSFAENSTLATSSTAGSSSSSSNSPGNGAHFMMNSDGSSPSSSSGSSLRHNNNSSSKKIGNESGSDKEKGLCGVGWGENSSSDYCPVVANRSGAFFGSSSDSSSSESAPAGDVSRAFLEKKEETGLLAGHLAGLSSEYALFSPTRASGGSLDTPFFMQIQAFSVCLRKALLKQRLLSLAFRRLTFAFLLLLTLASVSPLLFFLSTDKQAAAPAAAPGAGSEDGEDRRSWILSLMKHCAWPASAAAALHFLLVLAASCFLYSALQLNSSSDDEPSDPHFLSFLSSGKSDGSPLTKKNHYATPAADTAAPATKAEISGASTIASDRKSGGSVQMHASCSNCNDNRKSEMKNPICSAGGDDCLSGTAAVENEESCRDEVEEQEELQKMRYYEQCSKLSIPLPATAPPPPVEEWPQRPVLLRATEESWLVTRILRLQAKKNAQKRRWKSLPRLMYPPLPLRFMTANSAYRQHAIINFENPYFRGALVIRIAPAPGSAPDKDSAASGKKAMQACVQGQFLQRHKIGEILTGQAFSRPLRCLPPKWMVNLGLQIVNKLTSTLKEDIYSEVPYFLTPAPCVAENMHVAHSRKVESKERDGSAGSSDNVKADVEDVPYIPPPDVTEPEIVENTTLLGGPFAKGDISSQKRKSLMADKRLLSEIEVDPNLIYTFNFYQNIFYPFTYEFDLGIMRLNLVPFLNQQPIELMALLDDVFIRSENSGFNASAGVEKSSVKKNNPGSSSKLQKEGIKDETLEPVESRNGEQQSTAAQSSFVVNAENCPAYRREKNSFHKETLSGEAGESQRRVGKNPYLRKEEEKDVSGEEEEEEEEADASRWTPPEGSRKFLWRFQLWHEKLLQ